MPIADPQEAGAQAKQLRFWTRKTEAEALALEGVASCHRHLKCNFTSHLAVHLPQS